MTVKEIKRNHRFIASSEDDKEYFNEKYYEAIEQGGKFVIIEDYGDMFIYKNETHYCINDCGVQDLYEIDGITDFD